MVLRPCREVGVNILYVLLVVAHLGLLGVWLGAMLYSQLVVQPRAAQFFGADDDDHEAFLVTLGAGNRRPVLAIIAALLVTGALITAARSPNVAQPVLYAVEGVVMVAATAVFARVSWALWPRRVFALPDERPAHRAALRRHALALVALVGTAFAIAATAAALPAVS
jgi:hypothetical protein